MNNYQGNLNLGSSVVTSLRMADIDEVLLWNTTAKPDYYSPDSDQTFYITEFGYKTAA